MSKYNYNATMLSNSDKSMNLVYVLKRSRLLGCL